MSDSTDRLIVMLEKDLEPVRPLPRLRSAFAIVLAVWATFVGLMAFNSQGVGAAASLLGDTIYAASFVGLLIAALGGTISALAAGIPGRERIELVGTGVAAVGLFAAAIACLVGVRAAGGLGAQASPPGVDAMCFQEAALFSLLPAGVILSFLVRGWTARPIRAAFIALFGAGALGAGIVHMSCDFLAPQHLLMGHLSVPLVLGLVGLYPLAIVLRRLRG